MQKNIKNKIAGKAENNKESKVDKKKEELYFFPTYGKTIKATSREEAEAKLKAQLKKREEK